MSSFSTARSTPGVTAKPILVGLARTLALLGETKNEAALAVLIPALDSSDREVEEGALRAILSRRSVVGEREVLKRLHRGGERWRTIIGDGRGKLTQALRDAVLGTDAQMCANACDAILWFREYDLMQPLILAAEDDTNENAGLAAKTLLALADLLYEQLSGPRDYADRRDPQLIRAHVVSSLEAAVKTFTRHSRTEIMAAFLSLVNRENAVLKQILIDPMHPVYLPLVDALLHQERGGVVRLLLSFLDDPHAPSAAISVLARRSDLRFVQHVLRKIGYTPAAAAAQNLKRIENIPWLRGNFELLDQLDDAAQHSAVKLLMASNVKRAEAFKVIEHLLINGKVGGRRIAAEALAEFQGADANMLALKALHDEDPRVQAAVTAQLRSRGIPGALNRLIELVDSPHEAVRNAACECLSEFDYERYLATFDMLDEDARRSTGLLVKKINPHALSSLRDELANQSRTKRLRALAVTCAMDGVPDLEPSVIGLLQDEDHLVRSEAARALGTCNTQATQNALREALFDRSLIVQETAESSLRQLAQRGRKSAQAVAVELPVTNFAAEVQR